LNSTRFASGLLLLALLAASGVAAAVLPWMSLEEITGGAEVIVLGTVESAQSAWSADGRMIVTRTTVSVETSLKGSPRDKVIVETPGGRVGDQTMIASGAPVFRPGERVVLFLEPAGERRPDTASGSRTRQAPGVASLHAVVGWNLGRMSVRRDPRTGRDLVEDRTSGSFYLDRQGRPVGPERAGKGPAELRQFLREVERLVAAGAAGGAP
jgi:hypothetical protein